jgi:hypothetical protein
LPLVLCLAEEITLSLLLFLFSLLSDSAPSAKHHHYVESLLATTINVNYYSFRAKCQNSLGFPKLNWRQTVGSVRLHAYACAIYR